jgi:hypothetical protein
MNTNNSNNSNNSNTMNYGVIKIILQKAGTPDDVLTIRPNEHDDNYTVEFKQETINNVAFCGIKNHRIETYIENFVRTALIDDVGPDYFQVDVPSFPSAIVKRRNMPAYLPLLFKQILGLERDWPVEATPKSVNTHLVFDEEHVHSY